MSDNVSNSADEAVAEKARKVDWQNRRSRGRLRARRGDWLRAARLRRRFSPAWCAPCLAARLARPSTEFATLD